MYKSTTWYMCPKCGNPKLIKYRSDTLVRNFPAFCKRCKKEILINLEPEPRARANQ